MDSDQHTVISISSDAESTPAVLPGLPERENAPRDVVEQQRQFPQLASFLDLSSKVFHPSGWYQEHDQASSRVEEKQEPKDRWHGSKNRIKVEDESDWEYENDPETEFDMKREKEKEKDKARIILAHRIITSRFAHRRQDEKSEFHFDKSDINEKLLEAINYGYNKFTMEQIRLDNPEASEEEVLKEAARRPQFSLQAHQREGLGTMINLLTIGDVALLADEMGLGKTVQCLALLIVRPIELPSLIVVPASITCNWLEEFSKFTNYKLGEYFVFDGTQSYETLTSAKAVIVSYDLVRNQWKEWQKAKDGFEARSKNRFEWEPWRSWERTNCPLLTIKWGYLIIDEAHRARNMATGIFKSLIQIIRQKTVAVTGTPFSNEYRDIFSMFVLLKLKPFDEWAFYERHFIKARHNRRSLRTEIAPLAHYYRAILHLALSSVMIRRRQRGSFEGKKLTSIPTPRHKVISVALSSDPDKPALEWGNVPDVKEYVISRYDEALIQTFWNFQKTGDIKNMEMLLVKPEMSGFLANNERDTQFVMRSQWSDELRRLAKQSRRQIGFPPGEYYRKSMQARLAAVNWAASKAHYGQVEIDHLRHGEDAHGSSGDPDEENLLKLPKRDKFRDALLEHDLWKSTKIKKAIKLIKERQMTGNGKILVFSTWVCALDVLSAGLRHHAIHHTRLDGTIAKNSNNRTVQDFQKSTVPVVMLITNDAGGVGINLFTADTVIILNPEWTDSKEQQCIFRAVRIGQTHRVYVYKILAEYSADGHNYALQLLKKHKADALIDKEESAAREEIAAYHDLFEEEPADILLEEIRSWTPEDIWDFLNGENPFISRPKPMNTGPVENQLMPSIIEEIPNFSNINPSAPPDDEMKLLYHEFQKENEGYHIWKQLDLEDRDTIIKQLEVVQNVGPAELWDHDAWNYYTQWHDKIMEYEERATSQEVEKKEKLKKFRQHIREKLEGEPSSTDCPEFDDVA